MKITFENPRAYFVELPWQAWQASLPPSWTLFMPLNARRRNIYDEAPAANTGATGGGGGDANTGQTDQQPVGATRRNGRARGDVESGGSEEDGVEMLEMDPVNREEGTPVNRVRPIDVLSVMDGEEEEDELSTNRRARRARPNRQTDPTGNEERPLIH